MSDAAVSAWVNIHDAVPSMQAQHASRYLTRDHPIGRGIRWRYESEWSPTYHDIEIHPDDAVEFNSRIETERRERREA